MRKNLERSRTVPSERHALRVAAQREYSLLALLELSQGLTLSLDLYRVVDTLLFNLMGQLRTVRACLWLLPEDGEGGPVLVRSHGISQERARLVAAGCLPALLEHFRTSQEPVRIMELVEADAMVRDLAGQGELPLFAPVPFRSEVLGILGLGARAGSDPYSDLDLQILQASLAFAGVALQNERHYSRLVERHRELRIANERLREADRLKSEFMANVNHELRTPLTIIIASLDCFDGTKLEDKRENELLRHAKEQSRVLLRLIEGLLTFTAIAESSQPIDIVTADLSGSVEAQYLERLPGVAAGLRELTFTRDGEALEARFDGRYVRQILDALIDNAVKFTPPGSRIELRTHPWTLEGVEWARVDVADNGPGVPPERLPDLFEPFRQLDGSATRAVGGMGMGLALARRLAERLGGRLEAASQPGEGTTFSLLLPRP